MVQRIFLNGIRSLWLEFGRTSVVLVNIMFGKFDYFFVIFIKKNFLQTLLNPTSEAYDYILQEEDVSFFIAQNLSEVTAATADQIFVTHGGALQFLLS